MAGANVVELERVIVGLDIVVDDYLIRKKSQRSPHNFGCGKWSRNTHMQENNGWQGGSTIGVRMVT
jgi:hypothetical protein